MRFRFYREHKYVSYRLHELESLIAKTDFSIRSDVLTIKQQLSDLDALIKGHAMHEDNTLHALLKEKKSKIHELIEAEHHDFDRRFTQMRKLLDAILVAKKEEQELSLGYDFYLAYRLFVADNLKHFHDEETLIMPELQRLYTDDELRKIEHNTYHHMTPGQMLHMLKVLFPHMNSEDKTFFLDEMKAAEPEKFAIVSEQIHESEWDGL